MVIDDVLCATGSARGSGPQPADGDTAPLRDMHYRSRVVDEMLRAR